MKQLPAVTEHGAVIARVSVQSALAACAYMWPETALALPLASAWLERVVRRPTQILEAALDRGEVLDLTDEQTALFVQMVDRYYRAAKQGEFEHNLKLLATFIASELKAEVCEPGSFLDMARRLEGLNNNGLRAIAFISQVGKQDFGRGEERALVSAGYLANDCHGPLALSYYDAADALADLAGRGFLYVNGAVTAGKMEEFYHPTKALGDVIAKAFSLAELY